MLENPLSGQTLLTFLGPLFTGRKVFTGVSHNFQMSYIGNGAHFGFPKNFLTGEEIFFG